MANPVTDRLQDWKSNASGADDNLPGSTSPAGTGTSQELAGNLRLLKSEMKNVAENLSWEIWKGERNLANSANIAFTRVSNTQFTVNDDFLNAARLVAVVGRRVRALLSGSKIYGTISASSFSVSITTVDVVWDSGVMDATMTEIQFGPEARAIGGVQGIPYSATDPVANQVYRYDGTNMTPDYDEGIELLTNRTGGSLAVGDVVTLDTGNNSSVDLADTASTQKQLVVSLDAPADAATGRFRSYGIVSVLKVTGAVTRGNYLIKSATTLVAEDSGVAQGDTTGVPTGAFAIALSSAAGPGAGTVAALLLGSVHGYTAGTGISISGGTISLISGMTLVVKSADETVNNSATLQDDDHLVFALAANTSYFVEVFLLTTAANGATADWKFGWTVPAACTMFWGTNGDPGASHGSWSSVLNPATTPTASLDSESETMSLGGNGANNYGYILWAIVRNGANAGDLQFRWAQNTANASDSTVLKDSLMRIVKLQ